MSLAQVKTVSSGLYWLTCMYDFSSFSFPVLLQAVGPFALRNNMSINVYGVDDDEVIYPSSTLIPDRDVDLLLFKQ